MKTRKIFIASESVTGFQPFQNRFLLGSFTNKNTGSHFYSESLTPQIFASLLNVNSIAITLYDEGGKIIPKSEVDHISLCLVMMEESAQSHLMLSLGGEVTKCGDSSDEMEYLCQVNLPPGASFKAGTKLALTEIALPELYSRRTGRLRKVKGDEGGGIFHFSLESDCVAFDASLGTRLLRSFCVKTGQKHYAPPYPLFTKMTPGEYNSFNFTLKVRTCSDLQRLVYKGRMEIMLAITE